MEKLITNFFIAIVLLIGAGANAQCIIFTQMSANPANPVCKGETVTFNITSNIGGFSSYIWIVNGDTVSTNPSISSNINGAHVEVYAVSDTCGNGTFYVDAYIVNVEMQADYTVIVEECNQPVADVQIGEITGTGQEPYTYNFYTTNGNLGQTDFYTDVPVSTYPLVIEDANGCIDTTWIDMNVYECPPPAPTQVITPNEDGYNDTWLINFIELYPDNEVFIYDRWGQRVYHKKGYDNLDGWDAKYVGQNMPVSTYYYILKINFKKQDEKVYNGPISVFR